MKILGIDPGYGITGFGLIDAQRGQYRLLGCGAITTPPNTDFPWRLEVIYNDMTQLLQTAQPEAVAIEELFFGQNVTTGINVAQSRGVILLAIHQAGLPIFEYKPMQVKQAVVGYGNASKHQVQDMTKRLLHLQAMPKPDDAADAIAIALCHARSATSLLARAEKQAAVVCGDLLSVERRGDALGDGVEGDLVTQDLEIVHDLRSSAVCVVGTEIVVYPLCFFGIVYHQIVCLLDHVVTGGAEGDENSAVLFRRGECSDRGKLGGKLVARRGIYAAAALPILKLVEREAECLGCAPGGCVKLFCLRFQSTAGIVTVFLHI